VCVNYIIFHGAQPSLTSKHYNSAFALEALLEAALAAELADDDA